MNGSRLSSQGRLSLSLALPLARRGPSHIHDRHTPQTLQCTVCAERAAHRFSVLSFRPRIPTNKYKGLKKRDLYVSADDNHRYIVHSLVCVCAMCFSRSLPATKASTGTAVCLLAVSHCKTGARAFFGDFTWKERCSSARRNPECAGDFGFSTYKPRGIL